MHMHRATKPIVLAVSAVFGLGLVTAAAANSHGAAVSALAKTNGKSAHGSAVSAIAQSDATAAHTTGNKAVNHGGAVSTAARTR